MCRGIICKEKAPDHYTVSHHTIAFGIIAMISLLNADHADFPAQLTELLNREQMQQQVEQAVATIISGIRLNGDDALLAYTNQFDRRKLTDSRQLELDTDTIDRCYNALSPELRAALTATAERIRTFHEHEKLAGWQFEEADGTVLGQKVTAVDRAGIYVPGGKAAYPSSVLMAAIPAKVAGVKEIVMTVPTPDDEINTAVIAAAKIVGVDRVFSAGGAQAIAALAYGTGRMPRVDKIVGPGNIFVATAKKQVFGQVGIDMLAGPSEIVVVCDDSADPQWVAMDLLAQAEHDELAQAIAITTSQGMAEAVMAAVASLVPEQPRAPIIRQSLHGQGAVIVVANKARALELCNHIAPEHLELMVEDAESWLAGVRHAGAVLIGRYSAEALGDYCAGPNHVLPTAGSARFSSPLGVHDFQKRTNIIHASRAGAQKMARIAGVLADSEGLPAHAQSARLRGK